GETDEYGLPVRYPWAEDYRGKAAVVYGHTPVPEATWINGTICIDTGCVFGGKLTALRYPERELVSVPAGRVYYQPARPLGASESPDASPPPAHGLSQTDGVSPPGALSPASPLDRASRAELSISDVLGKRIVQTRLSGGSVTIRAENSTAALEVMSRFAMDPRWLVYLPPTMSPTTTSREPGLLEHPAEALAAYRSAGVAEVVCEEKHMGSRAVVVACRDSAAAQRRFGMAA